VGQVDRGHAARAYLALEAVSVGQGERQSVGRLGHAVITVSRISMWLLLSGTTMCSRSRDALRLGQRLAGHYLYVDGDCTNITRRGSGSQRRPSGKSEEQTTLPHAEGNEGRRGARLDHKRGDRG
jgi:hypothetical protein